MDSKKHTQTQDNNKVVNADKKPIPLQINNNLREKTSNEDIRRKLSWYLK